MAQWVEKGDVVGSARDAVWQGPEDVFTEFPISRDRAKACGYYKAGELCIGDCQCAVRWTGLRMHLNEDGRWPDRTV